MDKQSLHQSEISKIIADIKGATVDQTRWHQYLDTLEKFECWQPLFRLLQQKIKDSSSRQVSDFSRLAKVYSLYLNKSMKLPKSVGRLCNPFRCLTETFG